VGAIVQDMFAICKSLGIVGLEDMAQGEKHAGFWKL
jgi:hypothetical protein